MNVLISNLANVLSSVNIRSVIDCDQWKSKTIELCWQMYRTSLPVRDSRKIQADGFLFDRVYKNERPDVAILSYLSKSRF